MLGMSYVTTTPWNNTRRAARLSPDLRNVRTCDSFAGVLTAMACMFLA